jgi:hypothetical protein
MSSLELSPAKERKPRRRRTRTNVAIESYTVDQYCDAYNTSRTKLYAAWRKNRGPKFYLHGNRRRISREAAEEYQAALQAKADAPQAAADAQALKTESES